MYGSASEGSSRDSIASPADRTLSISPGSELPPMGLGMQRQGSDYGYPSQAHSLPYHMRSDYPQGPVHSTSSLTGALPYQQYTSAPQQRPTTSHPNSYGPPQTLEPPANGTTSSGASPSMGAMPWSPASHTLPPPQAMNGYYQESAFGHSQLPLFPGMGRPQSTEPRDYGLQQHQAQMGPHPAMNDWGSMSMPGGDSRQGHYDPTVPGHYDPSRKGSSRDGWESLEAR